MEVPDAKRIAFGLMMQHGLIDSGWRLVFDTARRRLGQCRYGPKEIGLSIDYVRLNDDDLITDTVLHEIAHALVGPRHGHGPVWKSKAIEIGAQPKSCKDVEDLIVAPGKYHAICPGCDRTYHRHKKPKNQNQKYWCRKCGPDRGVLTWVKT